MSSTLRPLASLLCAVAIIACASARPEDGRSEAEYTRQGGVLGQAPKLTLGRSASGSIKGGQIDAWAIDLEIGDRITVVQSIRRGTLAPDFGLFLGGTSHVPSASHEALARKLTKTYTAPSTGRYYLGVAPFEGRGAGDYSIKVSCKGGPCAGEPAIVELDPAQTNVCIKKARDCSLDRARPAAGASVTLTKARAVWKSCLEEASLPSGESCKPACDDGDAKRTCDGIVRLIPFFAKRAPSCTAALRACMSSCEEAGDQSDASEDQCLLNGYNNTCDNYARSLVACGGPNALDSRAACHRLCEANFGAWNDDLDTLCTDECGEYEE